MLRDYKYSSLCVVICTAVGFAACTRNPDKAKRAAETSGDRYVSQQKYREAIIEYRRALQYDPRFGEAHLKLGRSYLAIGDAQHAYPELVRAGDFLPDNAEAQLQADQVLLLTRRFDEAKQRAIGVLAKTPKNVDAHILLGNALAGLKDLDGAITQVEQAIDNDPLRVLSYTNLGLPQFAKGNRAAAEAAFMQGIAADPKSSSAHLGLANYYWASGQTGYAERELKAAADVDPKSTLANRALAAFYIVARRPADAEKYLKALAESSQGVDSKLTLADFYLTNGRTKDARAILDPLVAAPDGFVPAKLRIAAIEYAEGRRDEAHAMLEEVLKRDAKNEPAHLVKTRFLLRVRCEIN